MAKKLPISPEFVKKESVRRDTKRNMRLGAQFFSIRHKTRTPEEFAESFRRIADIGYGIVQISGVGASVTPEMIREASQAYGLPVTCTHTALSRIIEDTARVIEEHKLFGAQTVGLGQIGQEYLSEEGFASLREKLREPIAMIRDAGLSFAYHNHAFEFEVMHGTRCLYDVMIEDWQEVDFIPDVYWIAFGGGDPVEYVHRIGGNRIKNIHYKDLAKDDSRSICACGDGILDFAAITQACREEGIENVLVEQDNAPSFADAFAEMEKSYRHLKDLVF